MKERRSFKRVLTLILSLTLILGLTPASTLALENSLSYLNSENEEQSSSESQDNAELIEQEELSESSQDNAEFTEQEESLESSQDNSDLTKAPLTDTPDTLQSQQLYSDNNTYVVAFDPDDGTNYGNFHKVNVLAGETITDIPADPEREG
ncbi:MAG TPA: hypothetical protein DCM73_04790, partial [Clostridiales bacterium]|nr:hypothetical protein [Clostridiales bacterium]